MSKRGVYLLLIAILVGYLFITLDLSASVNASSQGKDKISSKVLKTLESEDKVPIMIKLKPGSQGSPGFSTASLGSQSSDSFEGISISKKYFSESYREIYGEVSASELEAINNNPNIESVEYSPMVHAFLQDSVKQIRANDTWPELVNGINLTGIDQTICIIDTGINYTHPDLGGCTTSQFTSGTCGKVIGGHDFVNSDNDPYDDNGHGTHVAGIAAANGTITGVAPGAKIVALKALDSGGSGSFGQIRDAINWCVGNSSTFNISVISMSLGTEAPNLFSSNCDSSFSSTADAINAAIAKNITVVVASGNDGNKTHISSPACITNVTAVASVNKTDSMSSFSNRNSLVDVTAPGGSINSTKMTSLYEVMSGTSMATPHVAGAIAVLQQNSKQQINRLYTPSQIETLLKNSGDSKNDTEGSGLNFSRINLFNSLEDLAPPQFSNISSQNLNYSTTIHFNISWTDSFSNIQTVFVEFNSVNYTGGNITNISSKYLFNISAPVGTHNLTWHANDTAGNSNNTGTLQINISRADPQLNLSIIALGQTFNSDLVIENTTQVNMTATSSGEGLIELILNGATINNATTVSNLTNLSVATHNVTAFYPQTQNFSSSTSSIFITAESAETPPRASHVSPIDEEYTNDRPVTFTINATDATLRNATLNVFNISGDLVASNFSNITGTFNQTSWTHNLTDGNYSWNALVVDNRSNNNFTDGRNFTLVVDTVLPNASLTVSDDSILTTETTDLACNGSDDNFLSINLTIDGNTNSSSSLGAITLTYDPSSSGSKVANCTVYDKAGNLRSNTSTITVTSPSSGGSGGGGGGGGSGGSISTSSADETAKFFQVVAANSIIRLQTTPNTLDSTGISEVSITMKERAERFEVSVSKASDVSNPLAENGEKVFAYISINHEGLPDSAIDKANINFEVPKSWLEENSFSREDVVLKRFTNRWDSLETRIVSETQFVIQYNSVSPGLSLFAITGEKKAPVITDQEAEEAMNFTKIEEEILEQEIIEKGYNAVLILEVVLVLIVAAAIIIAVTISKKHRKKK